MSVSDPSAAPEAIGAVPAAGAASAGRSAGAASAGRSAGAASAGREAATAPDGRATGAFQVGLLGHGTVGAAFAALLEERAEAIERLTGLRPQLCGTLTTSSGEFEQILAGADTVVELIGGIEPARAYVLAALRAGKHVITANKQLLSQHGEALFEAARAGGAQLRFEAAVAGVVPAVRVLCESLAGAHVERVHGIVNGTTNFILTEMTGGASYEQALAEAQRQGYAEADPSEDVSGKDAAAKMAILARLAFGAPVHLDQVICEGIEHLRGDDLQYARELGLGLKLIGTAERRDGGLSVRVHPAFLYSGHPLASVNGPYNAVTVESDAIVEITMSGPGAGGRETASAVLGDLVSIMRAPRASALSSPSMLSPAPTPLPLVGDVESAFYIHIELADRPGALAAVAQAFGDQGASIKSVVQHGLGEHARLVMVVHPLAESRLREALDQIGRLDFLRSTPRAIRVIEEEFT